jgi:hypothetical protein
MVEDVFLKKVKAWPDGEAIRPVDLAPGSTVRQRFSEQVLQRPVAAVRAYWQQCIFSGRNVPPPELDSDDEVIAYVLKSSRAIGYVSAHAELRGAKVVTLR